jgi:hypothetical protein
VDNNKKDIFAPPSEEELAMFSAPSKEELSNFSNDPAKMSASQIEEADKAYQAEIDARENEALLAGAAQGSTFGFSDELGATKDVVVDAFAGNKLGKSWRDLQQAREAANKKLAEESPWAYGAGEVIGGVGSSIVLPSVGAAKVASTASRFSPAIGKFLAGQSEGALARIAGKGINLGITSAPVGAAYGVGASENDISQPIELAKDALSGAGMGAITGAAIGAVPSLATLGAKKIVSPLEDTHLVAQGLQGYKLGKEGVNLGSAKTQVNLSVTPEQESIPFVRRMLDTREKIGTKMGEAVNNAYKNNVKINIDPIIKKSADEVNQSLFDTPALAKFIEPKERKILELIKKGEIGDLDPRKARELKDTLYNLGYEIGGTGLEGFVAKKQAFKMATAINDQMKIKIPGYAPLSSEFESFNRLIPETILSKEVPSDISDVFLGDLKFRERDLVKATADLLQTSQRPGSGTREGKATFKYLSDNLKELEKINPQLIKDLGGESAEDLIEQIKNKSDKIAGIQLSTGIDPQAGVGEALKGSAFGLATTGRGIVVSTANQAGRIVGGVKSIKEISPVKMGRNLFKSGGKKLQNLSERLKANESASISILGDALENSLANANEAGKNAVLFKLMQNPEYRNFLREEGLIDENEEE